MNNNSNRDINNFENIGNSNKKTSQIINPRQKSEYNASNSDRISYEGGDLTNFNKQNSQ